MSERVLIETGVAPPWYQWPAALCAVGIARVLAKLPPRRLRRALEFARRGARPATRQDALRARNAVVAVSMRCKGQWCLQRSIATALLCRMRGCWPDWCTGVRTQPFGAHAWVAVDGEPINENIKDIRSFHVVMTVPSL
ncbi:Transglutaminase-like superfamily protein [Thermomonospora echinospora]|uniref:Transglutaminase-like superfamily protein n=1 Tax=Thermomonospora echinospora TaxID=1992 RepID=A0A1H6D056_9ACTN|nr:lasso peptide biosynthesis B2 protein [Thermomonospora echinospora]SEG78809.1 Transglutaminase-like superfamily protein [Thermomonospora echinospora]